MDEYSREVLNDYRKAREAKPVNRDYFVPCISCGRPLVRAFHEADTLFGFIHRHTGLEECGPRYASPNWDRLILLDGTEVWNVHTEVFNMRRKNVNR